MVRYTNEQKAEIMQSIQEIGVAKTKEKFNVSLQTLYKWKNEASDAPKAKRMRKSAKTVDAANVAELLKNDGYLNDKINKLEDENARLRDLNAKLKRALSAFIG